MEIIIKQLLWCVLLVAIAQTVEAQWHMLTPKPEQPKENIRYIVIYRNHTQQARSSGGLVTFVFDWQTEIVGFETFDALANWLNGKNWQGKPKATITENQLIGAYELSSVHQLELIFEKEEKSLPKRIEIQEEKWEETRWRIKR